MKVETSFKPTDKQLFDEENKDFKYTQLILQAKTLQKAVKNIEKHYQHLLQKNQKLDKILKCKDQEIKHLK